MAAFNRSAAAIARNRERAAAWRRNTSSLPSSTFINDISNSSVEDPVPSSPIAEPLLLGSSPALSTMTPRCAPESPASIYTTAGANPMPQLYQTPFSIAQPTHGQRQAAHDPPSSPAQSQHQQTNSAAFTEPDSTFQQQTVQPSVAQSTHGQHPTANDSRTAPNQPCRTGASPVPALAGQWITHCGRS